MDYEPVLIGISFLDDNTGFMAGGQNGEPPVCSCVAVLFLLTSHLRLAQVGGPQVYKSVDAGQNWRWLPHSGAAMMFLVSFRHCVCLK